DVCSSDLGQAACCMGFQVLFYGVRSSRWSWLAISSVVLAVIIGLIGAGGKLSQNRLSGLIFEGYTTLIRGVPDLVLMLLIFYGLQIVLYTVTEVMGVGQIDIDAMVAGCCVFGFDVSTAIL